MIRTVGKHSVQAGMMIETSPGCFRDVFKVKTLSSGEIICQLEMKDTFVLPSEIRVMEYPW